MNSAFCSACLGCAIAVLPACADRTGTSDAAASSAGAVDGGGSTPVDTSKSCGHAHNDYMHPKPLFDALANGFCSVEVDIFLVDGDLLVAHTATEVVPERTLVGLYLDPLRELASQGKLKNAAGGIGPHGGPLQLLIDVKTDAEQTYAVLDPLLASYSDILTTFDNGAVHDGLVTAVVSGARAQATMAAQAVRYAAIDGRVGDPAEPVAPGTPASLIPLVSQNWSKLFQWAGAGDFAKAERDVLDGYVKEAHGAGRLLRFWATVDDPAVWTVLAGAGVDLVNVDDLQGFAAFKLAHDRPAQ